MRYRHDVGEQAALGSIWTDVRDTVTKAVTAPIKAVASGDIVGALKAPLAPLTAAVTVTRLTEQAVGLPNPIADAFGVAAPVTMANTPLPPSTAPFPVAQSPVPAPAPAPILIRNPDGTVYDPTATNLVETDVGSAMNPIPFPNNPAASAKTASAWPWIAAAAAAALILGS